MTLKTGVSTQKSLWEIALEEKQNNTKNITKGNDDNEATESHVLFCGSKDSGKTTIIQKFIEKDDSVKPTVALDYCIFRRARQNSTTSNRDIVHVWELAGGSSTVKMIDIIIKPDNILTLTLVMVLDLSNPAEIWQVQHVLISQIKQRIKNVIAELAKVNSNIEKLLTQKAFERIGFQNKDNKLVSPLLIPLLIVGSKYEQFQLMTSEKRQMVCKALRFIAYTNGACIQFFSTKTEGLNGKLKSFLNQLISNGSQSISKTPLFDINKPLYVPFGCDSLEQIGAPPVSPEQLSRSTQSSPVDLWRDTYKAFFPTENEDKLKILNPAIDKNFADITIDKLRLLKDQELDRYRKSGERKDKEAQLNARVGKK
ncbi:cytoplasmic dynein 2 light intermediate chain 1 isoform X3 [Hydra vulgaris]|uniref:Cytoplasmic dynein 2 light intermediate chain 1 n=1 Tax=Hydra vulgaris TaxID=6087 RepID=A0ABM4DFE1_HYDVU